MTTAATVKSVQGEAFARSPSGGMRRLSAGDTIQQGEVVITSLGGQVSLATVDGQMINVNSQESFKFGPEAAQATAPQAGEAAVQPVVAQPGEIDVAQILEQDAAAAGLAGGGENGGNSFVRLMRVTEGLTPLNYEFLNPAGADLFQPEGLAIDGQPSAGDLVISLDEDDISEGEISTAWVGAFQASFAPGTNFDALYDIGNSDEARGDDVPDPSPTTLSGHLNFSYGSDGVGDIRFNLSTAALTSGGLPVQFWLAADGHTLVGYVMEAGSIGEDQESSIKVIFSAEITDVAAGAFSFTLWGPLDHPDNTTEDNLVIPFGFTVTDSDGDAAVGTLTVNVDDDVPTVDVTGSALPTLTLDESPIGGGGDGVWTTSANFSGNFDGAYGADGPGDVAYALSLNGIDMGSGLYALDPENTDEGEFGQGAEIMLSMDGNDIVGTIDDTEYFRISVNADTGEVTFTRYESIWHADTDNHDDASRLNAATGTLLMTATVTDFDGDSTSASLDLSAGVFSIEDDGPTAALAEDIEVVTPLVVDESTVDDEETDEEEGDGIREATADFTGYFAAPAYGADGPGSVSYALVLTGEGVGSGLYAVDADADDGRGEEILLYQEGDVVEGRVDDQVYFTISVDNDPESDTFGQVTFAQNVEEGVSVWHGDTEDHDDVESLVVDAGEGDVANSLRLVQTVTDADGDEAKAALDLGAGVFQIEDDGPTADLRDGGDFAVTPLVVDESTVDDEETDEEEGDGIREATADFTSYFAAPAYGADGPGSVSYALVLTGEGVGSGLYAVDADADDGQGEEILLYQEGDVVEGRVDDQVYFTISVDNDPDSDTFGQVTFAQTVEEGVSVWHGDTEDHDDVESLVVDAGEGDVANSLQLVQTVTDADGDEAKAALDLGAGVFQIEDDGPTADLRDGGDFAVTPLVVDESTVDDEETDEEEGDGIREATADFTSYFAAPAYGADGPGSVSYALVLTGEGVGSGLYAVDADADDGQGEEILLYQEGDVVEGRVDDQVYFTISVDNDPDSDTFGQVTFAQNVEEGVSVWHGDTDDHDDVESLVVDAGEGDVANSLQLVQTVTDADGDEAKAALDLGAGVFQIEDDGPTADLRDGGDFAVTPLVVDESTVDDEETDEEEGDGIREATADFTDYFAAPAYGADGPGSVSYALVLTGEGVGSGLYAVDADADDGQGEEILLYQEGDVVEGRVDDQVYFTISVDNDPDSDTFGQVTFAQTVEEGVSVWHGDTEDHDDVESLVVDAGEGDVANSLQLVQTVTDADGDEAKAALDLGAGVFQIEDDGPMVTAPENAQGDYSFTATYQAVGYAGYNNSYGYYIKDANGNIDTTQAGGIIWANVKTAGTTGVTVNGYAPEQVGFFIIPNGAQNAGLANGDAVTFKPVDGYLQAYKGSTPLTGTGANIFFDKAALNVDGYSHVDDNNFPGNQNWEDLLGRTDSDYEDVNVNITWNGGLRVDESDLNINATLDLSSQFTVKPGADGLQSLTYALNVTNGTDSGLDDTATGQNVLLRMGTGANAGKVEGYVAGQTSLVVFTLSVDEDGKVTLDQIRAVEHPTADPNEYVTLANANLITLTATATDNDGDTASDTVNIGTLLHFADDRPLAKNDADSVKEDSNIVATGNVLTGVDVTGGDTNTTDGVADIAGADGGLSVTSLRTGAIGQWSTPTAMGSSGVISLTGTYGTLTLLVNGNYSYALNNAATNVQSLKEGETKTDAFTYAMKDADGDSGTATLTITITGTNDAPVVTVGGGTVYEAALATGTTPSATTEVATGLVTISDVDNTFTGATGEVVVKTQGSNGNASVAWNANAGKWEWTYTLATAVDNDASGTNVEPGVDAFVITVDDGSGGVVDKTINISIVDDTPVFNSVMDAILSSATQVNFDGNYSASFGADGVDYLSAVLGTSGYVGTTAVTYQKSVYSSTVTHVDVMNGATKLFSFYYESTTNAVNAVGGNHDGSVVINAFGDPDNVAGTQFFTLAVKADGTYSFDMISNTILSSTTVSGSDFGATSPQTQLVAPSGTLVITGTGGGNLVNGSNNGIGVKTIDISDGDNLKLDFQSQQAFVSFKLVQWTGNDAGQASVTLKLSDEGSNPNIFNLAVNKNDLSVSIIVTDDNGLLTGGLGGTSVYYDAGVWTVYVNNAFDDVDITNASKAPGFAINNITYDQVVTVEDLTMNFNLAVTDRDGDTSSLTDTLTVSMVNPDSTINATTITTGVDGNDGVVMVGNGDADTLVGGNGNDILIGDGGSDVLTGGAGSDTFKWELGDASVAGTVDHITDFNLVPKASGGDVLDLTDLLSGETNTALSLDAYLNFSAGTGADAGRAVITVDVDGSGAGTTGQAIVLDNITYTQLQSYAGGAGSDVDIINKLLTDGNLKVTGSP